MREVIVDAFAESALMVPWLLGVYLLVGFFERRLGYRLRHHLAASGNWGPLVGALLGLFPQCGFSVVGAALYSQGLISVGTLVAVILATSDEAISVILSHREHLGMLAPILVGKFFIAVVGGPLADWLFGRRKFAPEFCGHDHEHSQEVGCCQQRQLPAAAAARELARAAAGRRADPGHAPNPPWPRRGLPGPLAREPPGLPGVGGEPDAQEPPRALPACDRGAPRAGPWRNTAGREGRP